MAHPLDAKAHELAPRLIGAAIEVHKHFGPGLIESVYEWALIRELDLQGLSCQTQDYVQVRYKDAVRQHDLKFDVLVEGCLPVEVKAVDGVLPIHKAQLMTYLKLWDLPLGLLINFHEMRLADGVTRLFVPGLRQRGDES
jgi:GxxExxY protein